MQESSQATDEERVLVTLHLESLTELHFLFILVIFYHCSHRNGSSALDLGHVEFIKQSDQFKVI